MLISVSQKNRVAKSNEPALVERGFKSFDVVFYGGSYYAVRPIMDVDFLEALESGGYEDVLIAPDLPELRRRVDVYVEHRHRIVEATKLITAGQIDAGRSLIAAIHGMDPDFRDFLIEGYNCSPNAYDTAFVLGMLCWCGGNAEEGLFHLRRLVEADPCNGERLLVLIAALRSTSHGVEASSMMAEAKQRIRRHRIETECKARGGHVLWNHPEVVARTRGIIQVGANIGDELEAFSKMGIEKLLLFEPVQEAYDELLINISKHRGVGYEWSPVQMAVSDEVGDLQFWKGRESGNSSFLELHPDRSAHHKHNIHDKQITVPTTTLDRFVQDNRIDPRDYNMIFMDVQGIEHLVLYGARELLKQIDFVVLEVSYTEIYLGSLVSDQMELCFEDLGFVRYAEEPGCFAEQADSIYVRRDLVNG